MQYLLRYKIFRTGLPLLQFFCFHPVDRNYCILVLGMTTFTTAATLLGILSIRFWHTSGSIFSHSTCTLSHNSNIPTGALSYSPSFLLRCSHRCSMGLRSGDCAGHGKTLNPWSSNQVVAFWDLCLGSLSSWKWWWRDHCHRRQSCPGVHLAGSWCTSYE